MQHYAKNHSIEGKSYSVKTFYVNIEAATFTIRVMYYRNLFFISIVKKLYQDLLSSTNFALYFKNNTANYWRLYSAKNTYHTEIREFQIFMYLFASFLSSYKNNQLKQKKSRKPLRLGAFFVAFIMDFFLSLTWDWGLMSKLTAEIFHNLHKPLLIINEK